METVEDKQPSMSQQVMFPTMLSGYHGNKTSVKRPLEDSRYPPKKRALLEHRAQESLTSGSQIQETGSLKQKTCSQLQYETGCQPHESFSDLWQRSENVVSKVKLEALHEMYARPRSDSLHSNFSVISDNSDAVSTVSREDSPFSYHALYDHRTPERNPIRNVNCQIAKPLFQNSDVSCSVARGDKLNYGMEARKAGCANNVENTVGGLANSVDRKISVETCTEKGEDSLSVAYIPDLNKRTESVSEIAIENLCANHVNTSGCYDNSRMNQGSSHTGVMVSLIHRFNAEVPTEKLQNQSENKTVTQEDCAPEMAGNLPAQSNYRTPELSSFLQDQSDISQENIEHFQNQSRFSQETVKHFNNQSGISQENVEHFQNQSRLSQENVNHIQNQSGISQENVEHFQNQSRLSQESEKLFQNQSSISQENVEHFPVKCQTGSAVSETEDSGKEVYKCPVCSRLIKQRGHYLVHLKSHEDQNCKCRVCGEELQSLEKLQQHMKTAHKGDNPYKCEHCSREFSQYNNLRRHVRVHRAKIYKCELCDREFNEEFYLTMHMGTHTGKRVYSCGVCNACFSSSHDLKMHVKTHSPSQLHTCDVCGKSFSKACVLRQHKKGHSGDRPHKCEKCLKTFIHRHHLTMHMRSHTEYKPYTCDICKKEFNQSSHLYKHLRCHDNENEMPAVNAIKDRLGKLGPAKTVDKGRAKAPLPILAKKIAAPGEQMTNHLPGGHYSERSRSLVNLGHQAVDNKVMKSVTTSEQQIYMRNWQTPNSQSNQPPMTHSSAIPQPLAPSSIPQCLAPPVTGRTHFPLENIASLPLGVPNMVNPYHQLYQAYSAQARAYYDSMYMMNYMSQNAMLHPGNPVNQNGRQSFIQPSQESKLKEKRVKSVEADSEKVKRENKTVDLETKTADRANEEKTRAEVANELVRMSKARNSDAAEIKMEKMHPQPEKETYHIDNNKTVDFTKCISDVIDKTMKLQHKNGIVQPAGQITTSCIGKQFTSTGNQITYVERASRTQSGPERSANDKSSTSLKFSSPVNRPRPSTQDGALNLSQKKMKPDFPPQIGSNSPSVSSSNGSHGSHALSSSIWNYPSPVFSHHARPTQTLSHNIASHYPNLVPSFNLPYPSSTFGNNPLAYSYGNHQFASSPVLGMKSDSPKKRHASYHDMNRTGVALDLRNAGQTHRTRHVSESLADRSATSASNSGIELREGTPSDSKGPKTELYQVAREVTQDIMSSQASSEQKEDEEVMKQLRSEIDIDIENELDAGQESVVEIRSNHVENLQENEVENRTKCPDESERDLDDVDMNEGIVKVKDTCKVVVQAKVNYFDDSLEDRKLEIDFIDGERKGSGSSSDDINENSKVEFREDMCELEEVANEEMVETENHTVSESKDENDSKLGPEHKHIADEPTERHEIITHESKHSDEGTEESEMDLMRRAYDSKVNKTEELDDHDIKFSQYSPQVKVASAEATLTCGLCWERFSYTEELENHQVVHAREMNASNSCGHCERTFPRPFDLQCHVLKYHTEANSISESVEERAPKNTDSSAEEKERDEFECEFCGLKLTSTEEFRSHVTLHKGDKPYTCNLCLRSFAHKHNLNRHKMSHNSKTYECTVCQRTFKESFYLQMHMKIHSEEITRRCEICNQQVPKSEIWKHTNEHMGNITENPTYEQIGYRVEEILREQNLNTKVKPSVNMGPLRGQFQKAQQASVGQEQYINPIHCTNGNTYRKENIENLHIPMSQNDENCPKGQKVVPMARNVGKGHHLKEILSRSENQKLGNRRISIKAYR